ncbi:hypothetical protein SLA2020_351930 [Shorea laevis]
MATSSRNTRAPDSFLLDLLHLLEKCIVTIVINWPQISECRARLSRGNYRAPSHKAAAVTHTDASDMSLTSVVPQPSTLSPADIEAIVHQVLSKSNLNTAMSTTSGFADGTANWDRP